MKVVIDARWIFEQLTGIGTYTRELLRYLPRANQQHEYVALFDNPHVMERTVAEAGLAQGSHVRPERVPYGLFSARNQWALRGELSRLRADVFHSPNYLIPLFAFPKRPGRRPRCVVTIHDLIPLLHPEFTPRARKTRWFPVYRRLMREIAARADRIICPSEASRRDVVEALGVPAERVDVIPEGVDAAFRPPEGEPRRARTILYVGRLDPYKNVPRLVEALARVRARLPDARLEIVGPRDPRYPEADRAAAAWGVAGAVVWRGYLESDALVEAYWRAGVLALPSRAEGFGLPVLEAMACGTPVVCSRLPALEEVAGDAALTVDPDDAAALAEALLRVLTDPALAEDLRRKGLARARSFTWERTARETLRAYERACE